MKLTRIETQDIPVSADDGLECRGTICHPVHAAHARTTWKEENEEAASAGEVAKVRTWVHEHRTLTGEPLCWIAYHGDLDGSSGRFCIVEWNAVGITKGLADRIGGRTWETYVNSAHSKGAGAVVHGCHWIVLFADWRR